MLIALSRAASQQTNHSHSGLDLEEDSSDSENEKISCAWKVGLCIGKYIPTWGHFTFTNVGRSSAAGVLALFHCYLFLAGGTLIFINCCTALLSFYADWFATGSVHLVDFRKAFDFSLSVEFMGVFARSCIVLSVSADLIRFAYLLMIDAWRPDAFEAYRRLVVLDAWAELKAGEFYVQTWSRTLNRWQKTGDIVFQLLLHVTLNLIPITGIVLGNFGLADPVIVRKICLVIGTLHVLVFYLLSFNGELVLKLQHFHRAWQNARSHGPHLTEVMDLSSFEDLRRRTSVKEIGEAAEQRSVCVLCCTIFQWLQAILPLTFGLSAALLGVWLHRTGLVVVGCVWAILLLFVTVLSIRGPEDVGTPEVISRHFPRPEFLQHWGEKWCNLGFQPQVRQRYHASLMLGISAVIFGAFGYHSATIACLALLSFAVTRILWLRAEGKLGWLYAFVEWFITTIALAAVLIASSSGSAIQDLVIFLLLSVLRHFGFQRATFSGERVRISCTVIFAVVHVFFLMLTCFALRSFSHDQEWSAFGPAMNESKLLAIPREAPVRVAAEAEWPICVMRFHYGAGPLHDARPPVLLSLADFALMASLSYEASDRAEEACRHYFPHWRIERRPRPTKEQRVMDWSRFLMLTSEDNSTTVITVRGTVDFLDVLQDVALWLVPALMEGLNKVGPDISSGDWGKSISEYAQLFPSERVTADHTFKSVLEATKLMITAHPSRKFFLTGHSLGGGIAKMVGLQLPIDQRPLTIAFASPGVQFAARVLFSHQRQDGSIYTRLRHFDQKLDVIPRHDLVSRIDQYPGNTLVAPCKGHPWQCHSIFRILWGIFSTCGSMTHSHLTVPCEAFAAATPPGTCNASEP